MKKNVYYIVLRLYPLIVPFSQMIKFPVSGFYAVFTIFLVATDLLSSTLVVTLLMLFTTE